MSFLGLSVSCVIDHTLVYIIVLKGFDMVQGWPEPKLETCLFVSLSSQENNWNGVCLFL